MTDQSILNWLLEGDISIQYQVYRDLLNIEKPDFQARIEKEGWGARLLQLRGSSGHWGAGFYQPKWISSHYTLLELRNLCISNRNSLIEFTLNKIVREDKGRDGGINPAGSVSKSDVCINGMFLNYASYFGLEEEKFTSIIDFILSQQLADGGFNCQLNRKGATHSSLHTTLSIIEGINEFSRNGYKYRLPELKKAEIESREFILEHRLYKSHRTGNIIDKRMLMLPYPSRWYYDILKVLDYFRLSGTAFDNRMTDALDILLKKRRKDNTWPLQAKHPGKTHFEMETPGKPSRWNTLRALRVLNYYSIYAI